MQNKRKLSDRYYHIKIRKGKIFLRIGEVVNYEATSQKCKGEGGGGRW